MKDSGLVLPPAPPTLAIVGRPNVGKSTLFNRLAGRRIAIVDDQPGVTRDSLTSDCRIEGKRCRLVDTGGLTNNRRKDTIEQGVDHQILTTIEKAALVLFVADVASGPMPEDRYVADTLRRMKRPVVLVANKADTHKQEQRLDDLYELGLGEPQAVSALHGRNMEELCEHIAKLLPRSDEPPDEERIRFCLVGRPNVGKSSLANAILGQERCIVSPTPGTTRDSIATDFSWNDIAYTVVDTAGQRRRKGDLDNVEFYSITRARDAIKRSDVAVLVLDATQGLLEGDKRIASAINEYKRGFLLLVNKMDLISAPDTDSFISNLLIDAPFLRHTPILFISAMHREGMDTVLKHTAAIRDRLYATLPQDLLENIIYDIRALFSPGSSGRRVGEIRGVIHDRTTPPRVVLKVNDRDLFPPAYMRLIENRLRDAFDLAGVPLDLNVSSPPKKPGRMPI
jgi:GTPase